MSFTTVEKNSEGYNFDYGSVGRLQPGVTISQAQQDVNRVFGEIHTQYPESGVRLRGYIISLREEVTGWAALASTTLGRRGADPTHRLRQSDQLAVGTGCRTEARIRSSSSPGRSAKNDVPAIADRKPPAWFFWLATRRRTLHTDKWDETVALG
jgi:hypothetical protein